MPTPEPAIHVHHDPKVHHRPSPSDTPSSAPQDNTPHFAADEDSQNPDADPSPAPGLNKKHPVKLTTNSDDPSVDIHKSRIVVKAPVEDLVAPPSIQPVLAYRRGHLIVPPALKGSHEILLHQNEMADREGLDRVQDDDDLDRLREAKLLVAIPTGAGLQVDDRLPYNRRYCRPWTARFLAALGRAHYARFHSALQVNSAVRTVEFQQRLLLTNGNAAPAEGDTASPHLTGQAVDLAKHGLSMTEIAWLRGYLLPLVQQGKVDVEEEFQQACFHVSVYRQYLPQQSPRRVIQGRRGSTATSLAAAIR